MLTLDERPVPRVAPTSTSAPGPAFADRRAVPTALLAAIAVVFLVQVPEMGPDLWWQVHTGERILAGDGIPRVDHLSFTAAGDPWIDHEWLAEVVFAVVAQLGGSSGIHLLRLVLVMGFAAAMADVCLRRCRSVAVTSAATVAAVAACMPYLNVRPHTFSWVLLLIVVALCDRMIAGDARAAIAIPFVITIWANTHGGFVVGCGYVAVAAMAAASRRAPAESSVRAGRMALVALTSLVATIVNPYGLGLHHYLIAELGADHSIITEWAPLTGIRLWFVLVLAGSVVGGWAARAWRERSQGGLVHRLSQDVALAGLVVAATAATVRHARAYPLVVMAATVLACTVFGGRTDSGRRRVGALQRSMRATAWTAGLVAVAAVRVVGGLPATIDIPPSEAPAAAVAFIDQEYPTGRIVSHLDWGGFLIWALPETHLVAVDGRNLTVYDDQWVDGYLRALRAGTLHTWLGETQGDIWLLKAGSRQVDSLTADDRWVEVYRDDAAHVFVAAGSPGSGEVTTGTAVPLSFEEIRDLFHADGSRTDPDGGDRAGI